jgi:hypothetical protein
MTDGQLEKLVDRSRRACTCDNVVQAMIDQSRRRNAEERLTGVLVYDNRSFLQFLEGSRPAIAECFLRISRSPLHRDIEVGVLARSAMRLFNTWHMATFQAGGRTASIAATWRRITRTPHDQRLALFEMAFLDWFSARPS